MRLSHSHSPQHGVTLLELMVAVAIVGVLASISVLSLDSTEYAQAVRGFADEIAATCEVARERAVATRRWQQLEIAADAVNHWEAATEGMGSPEEWRWVQRIAPPNDVRIAAVSDRARIEPGQDADARPVSAGEAFAIELAPDGTGRAATVYVGERDDERPGARARVVVYRATGSAYVYDGW